MNPKIVKWTLIIYVGGVIIGWIGAGAECMYRSDNNNFDFVRERINCLWSIFWPLEFPCTVCTCIGAVIGLIARILIKGVC